MDEKKTITQQVTVRVPDHTGQGVYANIVSINASDNEVILDFILNVPNQGGQAVLASRVIVSPTTAQQLSDLLEALLRQRAKTQKEQIK